MLVIDNPLAIPGPLWTAMMQACGGSLTKKARLRRRLASRRTPARHNPHILQNRALASDRRHATPSPRAVASALLVPQLYAVIMLVNLADYNPRGYRGSARWERDRAVFRRLCETPWAIGAELLVVFEDMAGLKGKIRDLPPLEEERDWQVGLGTASLGEMMQDMFGAFSSIALAGSGGERGAQFRVLGDEGGVECKVEAEGGCEGVERALQSLVAFLGSMLQEIGEVKGREIESC